MHCFLSNFACKFTAFFDTYKDFDIKGVHNIFFYVKSQSVIRPFRSGRDIPEGCLSMFIIIYERQATAVSLRVAIIDLKI